MTASRDSIYWGDPYKSLTDSRQSDLKQRWIFGALYFSCASLVVYLGKQNQLSGALIWTLAISLLLAAFFFSVGFGRVIRKNLVLVEFSEQSVNLHFHIFDMKTPKGRSIEDVLRWTEVIGFLVPYSSNTDDAAINVALSYRRPREKDIKVVEMEFEGFSEAYSFVSVVAERFGFAEVKGTGFRQFLNTRSLPAERFVKK